MDGKTPWKCSLTRFVLKVSPCKVFQQLTLPHGVFEGAERLCLARVTSEQLHQERQSVLSEELNSAVRLPALVQQADLEKQMGRNAQP